MAPHKPPKRALPDPIQLEGTAKRKKSARQNAKHESIEQNPRPPTIPSTLGSEPFESLLAAWKKNTTQTRTFRAAIAEHRFIEDRLKSDYRSEKTLKEKYTRVRTVSDDKEKEGRVRRKLEIVQDRIQSQTREQRQVYEQIRYIDAALPNPTMASSLSVSVMIKNLESQCLIQEMNPRPIHPDDTIEVSYAYDAEMLRWERLRQDLKECKEVLYNWNALAGESELYQDKLDEYKAKAKDLTSLQWKRKKEQEKLDTFRYEMARFETKLYDNAKQIFILTHTIINQQSAKIRDNGGICNLEEFVEIHADLPKPSMPSGYLEKRDRISAETAKPTSNVKVRITTTLCTSLQCT